VWWAGEEQHGGHMVFKEKSHKTKNRYETISAPFKSSLWSWAQAASPLGMKDRDMDTFLENG